MESSDAAMTFRDAESVQQESVFSPEAVWITSPTAWGERSLIRPESLGAWIAPKLGADAPHFLETTFTVPENRGIVGGYVVGAVQSPGTSALLFLNGKRGSAGGEVATVGAEYPVFEGELSPWIVSGENRLRVLVTPQEGLAPGISLRLVLEFGDGGTMEIVTDADWKARPADESTAPAPVVVYRPRNEDDGISRKRLYAAPFPAAQFRRLFPVTGTFRRALLHICGLGVHECWLNNKRVSDNVLDPAQTAYDQRAFYVTHDVTRFLRTGRNALGFFLADGWYGQNIAWRPHIGEYGKPGALVTLEIERESGERRVVVVSDAAWRTADGPIRAANLYQGEYYDARREFDNWTKPNFNDSRWRSVEVISPRSPQLEPQTIPPMRRHRVVRPVRITEPKPGVFVCDLGENIVGWARLKLIAAAGVRVRLRYGEALNPDGTVDFRSTGTFATRVVQTDEYVCRGGGPESYEPRFTYHGFQYVEVVGLPDPPAPDTVVGIVVHTDLTLGGAFQSSDETLNQIETLTRRSLVGNLHGIVSDCPHRERCEWNADAEIIADYALYNYNAAPLFAKVVDDVATTLGEDGLPLSIAVGKRTPPRMDIGWSTIVVQVPWRIYLFRGDKEPLQRHFDLMRRFIEHYLERAGGGVLSEREARWGDHAAPPVDSSGNTIAPCPLDAYASFLLYESTTTLAQIADALGDDNAAATYRDAAQTLRTALLAAFFDTAEGGYAHQTLDAYALLLNLFPDGEGERLTAHFRRDLTEREFMNIGGFFGYRRIAEAAILHLPEAEALRVLTQDKHPGIPWSIAAGATSLWERMVRLEGDYRDLNSLNHFAFGSVSENFWRHLAGILPEATAPGFQRFSIVPRLTRTLEWVRAHHDAPQGRIRSMWSREGGEFLCEVGIPPNTEAVLLLPRDARDATIKAGRTPLRENGQPRLLAPGIEELIVGEAEVRLRLTAGAYRFRILGAEG